MPRRQVSVASVLVWAFALLMLPAAALAKPAVYRDPANYKGFKKAPPVAPLPPPPSVPLSSSGTNPDVLVDEAGTAHITWNEDRGDDADAAVYCRLQRAASACDTTATLTWDKTYGIGDGPEFNIDNGGPRIIRVGNQLVIFSKRYPTIGEKPDGASSSTVVAWTSSDGGTTWSTAAIVGKRDLGQLVLIGGDDNPTIVNLGTDPLCGGMCVEAFPSGQYSGAEGILNTDPNSNYDATLVRDGDSLLAGFTDLGPRIWLRRWNGTLPITNPSNWSVSSPFPGAETELASGPAGTFLLSRPNFFDPFEVRQLTVGGDNVAQPGTATRLSPAEARVSDGHLIQDPSGRLIAAWQQDGSGVQLSTSRSGADGFTKAQQLIDGDANGQIELAATDDGGGFAAFNHTGGINSPGEITAVGFGRSAPTERLGIRDIPGGGNTNVTCEEVQFGSFDIANEGGCFFNGLGKNANLVVTDAEINLNGLRIVPDAGAKIVIDPKALTIDTIGEASVILSGGPVDIVLFHGVVKRNLANLKDGATLFEFPNDLFDADILGFGVSADLQVKLEGDGVRIPVDLELPPELGGFTGHAELTANRAQGLQLNSLHIHIGPVPLGPLIIETIDIDWENATRWSGRARLTVPAGGTIDAHVAFENGDFAGAGFDYTLAPPILLGPFVYLLSIGGDFFLEPVKINARASLGGGAAIAGEAPVKVNGEFTMLFPDSGPASFALKGGVDVFMIHVGDGFLNFQTDGYAAFGGDTSLSLGPLSGSAHMDGFVDGTTGDFGASIAGSAEFCAEFDIEVDVISVCGSIGTEAAVSNIGFAACAILNPPDPFGRVSGGLAVKWADVNPAALVNPIVLTAELIDSIAIPCSTKGFKIPPPRPAPAGASQVAQASQAGGQLVAIPGGLPTATILVKGQGGKPSVTVAGPSGQTIGSSGPTETGYVNSLEGANAVWVVLDKPAAGDWTVTPNPGSPAISEILVSEGYEPATVKADVSRGRISYRVQNLGEQTVSFQENGRFGTHVLGEIDKPRGTLRFKPAGGQGGKRQVTAMVQSEGLVTDQIPVGNYIAPPPPRPAAVTRLRAKRGATSLTVSFKPPRGAVRTKVIITGSRGTELAQLAVGGQRTVRFEGVKWDPRFRVAVRSYAADGRAGPVRRLTVKR